MTFRCTSPLLPTLSHAHVHRYRHTHTGKTRAGEGEERREDRQGESSKNNKDPDRHSRTLYIMSHKIVFGWNKPSKL